MFDEYRKAHPKGALTEKYLQALTALDHGKHKTATKLFLQLSQEDPKCAGAWTSLGTCYMWSEEFQKGLECATKALALRANDPDMYYRRSMQYVALLKYPEAIADLSKGLKLDPKDRDILRMRGESYKAIKKYPEAIADINAMLKIYPQDENTLYVKAEILEAMKDWKNAIKTYDSILTDFSADDHALVKRATVKMKVSDYKGAVSDFSEALKVGTEAPDFVYTQRSIAFDKLGMKAKAARDRELARQESLEP